MTQKVPSKRNALPTVFGFDFQVIAGLILTLKNLKDVKSISIEGPIEDIEIELNNGKYIYAQAKAVVNPLNNAGNQDKFREGLVTLDEASRQKDAEKLIYVSNTYYPLGKQNPNNQAYWPQSHTNSRYTYQDLKDSTNVNNYVLKYSDDNDDFDLKKFEIHFHKFLDVEDTDTRYKLVYDEIEKFLRHLGIVYGSYTGVVFQLWHSRFHKTQTEKQFLSKEHFLWPLVVHLSELSKDQTSFNDYFDVEDEIVIETNQTYRQLIEDMVNSFETSNLIINDFNMIIKSGDLSDSRGEERIFKYINIKWREFQPIIFVGDEELQELVVQLVMWRILTSRTLINKVKKEGGL